VVSAGDGERAIDRTQPTEPDVRNAFSPLQTFA